MAEARTLEQLTAELRSRRTGVDLEQEIKLTKLEIEALELATNSPDQWAEMSLRDERGRNDYNRLMVEWYSWMLSDECHTMKIAAELAPLMWKDPTDDIAARAVSIVAAVRARFVQGES